MKQFVVVKYDVNKVTQLYFSDMQRGRNRAAHKLEQDGTDRSEEFEPEQNLYFCDSEDDANALVEWLLSLYPQYIWAVATVGLVMSRPPGPITKAMFTEKGLLPA
jgi:hypothetical protein